MWPVDFASTGLSAIEMMFTMGKPINSSAVDRVLIDVQFALCTKRRATFAWLAAPRKCFDERAVATPLDSTTINAQMIATLLENNIVETKWNTINFEFESRNTHEWTRREHRIKWTVSVERWFINGASSVECRVSTSYSKYNYKIKCDLNRFECTT